MSWNWQSGYGQHDVKVGASVRQRDVKAVQLHRLTQSCSSTATGRSVARTAAHTAGLDSRTATAAKQNGQSASHSLSSAVCLPSSAAADSRRRAPSSGMPVDSLEDVQRESLQLLDWPALCRQVAAFASTPMAAEPLLHGQLPLGASQDESERLLQETAEAQSAQLDFGGVQDVRLILDAAKAGRSLHPLHLTAVSSTLEAAAQLEQAIDPARYPALARLGRGIAGSMPDLAAEVWRCIGRADGAILDGASDKLSATRAARRENLGRLRAEIEDWARTLHRQGSAERAQVVVRRDRLCVAVKAGRQGDLPKGSLHLATSSTGATFYMDPAATVPLNNAEAVLAGKEAAEEARILAQLTAAVADRAGRIRQILDCIAALDLCSARAKHAAWCGGRRPRFLAPEEAAQGGSVQVESMQHPLLLQRSLPRLPQPPTPPPPDFETSYLDLVGTPGSSLPDQAPDEPEEEQELQPPPRSVDFMVPPGVSVVTVTGPNTGGKTASLKALGLAALMPKAGLFLPLLLPGDIDGNRSSSSPAIAWFDAVLADVGDGQSLQQSLSTFSGHVRRLCNVLATVTWRSLVLLDEVASGTDPAEGAALAGALLDTLAGRAALTLATTHHASLKVLPARDARFCNASMEFDLASLAPTYRLMWRSAGASNALSIAQGLGFDPLVIEEARKVAADASFSVDTDGSRAAALRRSMEEELIAARTAAKVAAAAKLRAAQQAAAAEAELERARAEEAAVKVASAAAKDAEELASQQAELDAAVAAYIGGKQTLEQARCVLTQVRARVPDAGAAAQALQGSRSAAVAAATPKGWVPAPGDEVAVLSMPAAATGRVLSIVGAKATVKVGKMTMQVMAADLAPAQPKDDSSAGSSKPKAKLKPQAKKAKGDASSSGSAAQPLTIQFEHNTMDVRGMRTDEAAEAVEEAVACAPSGSAIFVVHGMGTGRLRAEVQALLKRSRQVARVEQQESSAGGCTMAVIK